METIEAADGNDTQPTLGTAGPPAGGNAIRTVLAQLATFAHGNCTPPAVDASAGGEAAVPEAVPGACRREESRSGGSPKPRRCAM